MTFSKNIPTRQKFDAICSDLPIYFVDEEWHKALTNTCMLVKAGIMSADGKVLKSEIRGGEIVIDSDGKPKGFLKEQASTYTRSFLDNEDLYTFEIARKTLHKVQKHLLSKMRIKTVHSDFILSGDGRFE